MKHHLKYKPFLIAEIGINHNGSIKLKKLIDLAKNIILTRKISKKRPRYIDTRNSKKCNERNPGVHILLRL